MNYSYKGITLRPNRDEIICELCKGKKVLHIGATDAPFTEEKLGKGLLLHTKLMEHAQSVYGIDIDQKAIDYLQTQGINNIALFDMNKLGDIPFAPDVIVFGEIIEHLQNLETALNNLKSVMTPDTELLISTPNQLYVLNFLITLIQNRECIHEDHKIGFTYGSLTQLLSASGLTLNDFYFTFLPRSSEAWYKKISRLICRFRPGVAETLLAVAKRN